MIMLKSICRAASVSIGATVAVLLLTSASLGQQAFTSPEDAAALVARTHIWKLAESLGGVESMIEVPTRMTHASTAEASFAVPGELIRLSVGIEAAEDLLADLDRALT